MKNLPVNIETYGPYTIMETPYGDYIYLNEEYNKNIIKILTDLKNTGNGYWMVK